MPINYVDLFVKASHLNVKIKSAKTNKFFVINSIFQLINFIYYTRYAYSLFTFFFVMRKGYPYIYFQMVYVYSFQIKFQTVMCVFMSDKQF